MKHILYTEASSVIIVREQSIAEIIMNNKNSSDDWDRTVVIIADEC
jgi:hypothetical protein